MSRSAKVTCTSFPAGSAISLTLRRRRRCSCSSPAQRRTRVICRASSPPKDATPENAWVTHDPDRRLAQQTLDALGLKATLRRVATGVDSTYRATATDGTRLAVRVGG